MHTHFSKETPSKKRRRRSNFSPVYFLMAAEGATSTLGAKVEPERLLDVLALVAQHTQDLSATRLSDGRYRLPPETIHYARATPQHFFREVIYDATCVATYALLQASVMHHHRRIYRGGECVVMRVSR